MSFLTFGVSVQCKNKEHDNQDKFGSVTVKSPSGKEVLVAAVADGVSMCFKGEIASYNAVRYVLNWAAVYFSTNEFNVAEIPNEFDKLITNINQNLNHHSSLKNKKQQLDGYSPYSSTTLSCVITDGDKILYFNIGDSSIYELKHYSTTNIMSKSNHVTASGHLVSFVGGIDADSLDIRYIESEFDNSAVYFLCTDGMNNQIDFNIDSDEFRKFNQRLLSADTRTNGITVLKGMVEYVLSKDEHDDITALVVKGKQI